MRTGKNALEWSVFVVSLGLIATVIVVLALEAVRSKDALPELHVTTGEVTRTPSGHRVPVTVRNSGYGTAEEVRVEVVLRDGQREVETSELTFTFLPRRSRREGWAVFDRDPGCCSIEARVTGFERP